MGLLSGLFWTAAGGAYAAGKLFKDNVNSQGLQYADIVHDPAWYRAHAYELDHDRQAELFQIYREDPERFGKMADYRESQHNNQYFHSTGGVYGGYFEKAAKKIADIEGWLYDDDFRLNQARKDRATYEAMKELDECILVAKESRSKYQQIMIGKGIPYIGPNYHWWVKNEDTGFDVRGILTLPTVTADRRWQFGRLKTEYPCDGGEYLSYDIFSEGFFVIEGYWYVNNCLTGYDSRNTGISYKEDSTDYPTLEDDMYFWCGENKIPVFVSYSGPFRKILDDNMWHIDVQIYRQNESNLECIGGCCLNTKIPIISHYRMREDKKYEAKMWALADSVWNGWEDDTNELFDPRGRRPHFLKQRNEKRENFPSVWSKMSCQPNGDEIRDKFARVISVCLRSEGIVYTGQPDPKTLEAERKRRLKAHKNPVKLNEWCNLFFDLVYGEEKLRAESPGEYEKLLEKFKEITGEDFVRGVDYLDKLRGLAIADGWYIPEISNKWFDNPPPPEPPEEPYGTAELPTRYL